MSQGNAFSTRRSLTRDEVAARVIPILAEQAGMAPEELRDSHSLIDDLLYDSLTVVETVMELEEEFDVEIADDAADGMRTVGDVIDGMCRLLEDRAD
ncbi:MAG: acyl carrier protein [Planctomycetaceae bacterium]|jgi:acyl carrier protein|nr:acyl carrier protein [Planctomycetaceae bacterium]